MTTNILTQQKTYINLVIFGLVLIIGLVARLMMMDDPPWYDELYTYHLSTLNPAGFSASILGDVHPPLYYALAWLVSLGQADIVGIRIPALFSSYFALFVVILTIDQLGTPFIGRIPNSYPDLAVRMLALSLMVLAPAMLYYSTEARMYTVLLAVVWLGYYGALSGRWYWLALSLIMGMFTHNVFILIYAPLICCMWLWYNLYQIHLAKIAVTVTLAGLAWLGIALQQIGRLAQGFWILPPTPGRFINALSDLILYRIPEPLAYHGPLAVLVLIALGSWVAYRKRALFWLVTAYTPLVIGFVLSLVIQSFFIPRLFIACSPALFVLMGYGLVWIYKTMPDRMEGYVLAGLVALPIVLIALALPSMRTDYSDFYAGLQIQPGDVCYHIEPGTLVMAKYYHPQCDHYLRPETDFGADSLTPQSVQPIAPMREFADLPNKRTWLFFSQAPNSPEVEIIAVEKILGEHQAKLVHKSGDISKRIFWVIDE